MIGYAKKVRFQRLARRYGFDAWHAASPFEWRPYKSEVLTLARRAAPNAVLEIGCGLGEIVSRVECQRRIGVDVDGRVIECARYLYGRTCQFLAASVFDIGAIAAFAAGKIDLLILVNWPHGMAWPELHRLLRELVVSLKADYILIDGIEAGVSGYPFHHGRSDFAKLGKIAGEIRSLDGVRTLYLISVAGPCEMAPLNGAS